MSATATIQDVVSRVPGEVNGRLRSLFVGLLIVGVVAFGLTLIANPQRAWSSMLFNLTYWLTLSQAGVVLAALFLVVKAKWATPMQRIALGTGSFLPWAFVLLVVTMVFGRNYLFSWIEEPIAGKEAYLNVPFLLVRQVGIVGLFVLFSMAFMGRIRRLDAGLGRGSATGAIKARFESWSKGWKGDEAEIESAHRVLPRFAAAMIPLYAGVFTLVCWDLVMSLDPHWSTTMLGAWFFMGGILMGFATLSVLSLSVRKAYGYENWMTPKRYHDLGKLIFAFSIFWTYLFFSMYLPIWYANMPEESNWMVLRVNEPFKAWTLAAVAFTFAIPFTGFMNLAAKRNPVSHLFFAVVVLVGLWLERLVLTYPSIFHDYMPVGFPEIGLTLGFVGAFGLVYQRYAATRPLVGLDTLQDLEEGHP